MAHICIDNRFIYSYAFPFRLIVSYVFRCRCNSVYQVHVIGHVPMLVERHIIVPL
jgi:hypothetical protein